MQISQCSFTEPVIDWTVFYSCRRKNLPSVAPPLFHQFILFAMNGLNQTISTQFYNLHNDKHSRWLQYNAINHSACLSPLSFSFIIIIISVVFCCFFTFYDSPQATFFYCCHFNCSYHHFHGLQEFNCCNIFVHWDMIEEDSVQWCTLV